MRNIVTKLLMKTPWWRIRLDLTQLMTYCLTPVLYCIVNADLFLAKTNKANSFSVLTKDTMDVRVLTENQRERERARGGRFRLQTSYLLCFLQRVW